MRFLLLLLVAVSAYAASPARNLSNQPQKALSFSFEKVSKNPRNLPRHLRHRKRANTVLERLDNQDFLYFASVSIGTPPQSLRLHLDTGSSDVWVESASSDICSDDGCNTSGTFDTDASSTYKKVNSDFSISYVDGDYAKGDYGTDVFHIGGVNVTDLQFGIGLDSTSTEGIMGIGFNQNEAQVVRLGKDPYRNLVDLMSDENLINSRAYSLWLNDLDASTGQILFGGVDKAKFEGNLTTLPMDKRSGQSEASEFMITLTGVSLTNENGKSLTITDESYAVATLLDTGSSYTYLPTDLAKELSNAVGAQYSSQIGVSIVPCTIRDYSGSVNYNFSGAIINVPLNELAVDAFTNDGNLATFTDGTPLCYFGIMDAGSESNVLGDTFLRSAYVVYDLDNEEISLGKTIYNVTDSDVSEIGSGSNAVPDATPAVHAVTLAATATGGGRINDMPFASGEVTMTGTGIANPTSTSSAASLKLSLGSALSLTVVLLFCCFF